MRLIRKLFLFFSLLLPIVLMGQVSIVGGAITKVSTEGSYPIACYVVWAESSYTLKIPAPSSSQPLKRYHRSIEDAQQVNNATYSDGAWHVPNAELNCGYILEKDQGLPDYFWFSDYKSVHLPQGDITATYSTSAPCDRVVLSSSLPFASWMLYAPDGTTQQVRREFRIRFQTLQFNEERFAFEGSPQEVLLPAKNGTIELLSPLTDTAFEFLGDNISESLGIKVSPIKSNELQARRLELHTRYALSGASQTTDPDLPQLSNEISAPATITMQAIANEPVASRYVWRITPGREASSDVAPIFIYNGKETEFTLNEAGTFHIFAEVVSRDGECLLESEHQIISVSTSRLEVPNAFSPGVTPGINDLFRVVYSSLISFEGVIFNEWGNPLFRWSDPSEGWDGTYGGRLVPAGVYYYAIKAKGADGKEYDLRGHINIVGYEDQQRAHL